MIDGKFIEIRVQRQGEDLSCRAFSLGEFSALLPSFLLMQG
jgi:hypothetical protein